MHRAKIADEKEVKERRLKETSTSLWILSNIQIIAIKGISQIYITTECTTKYTSNSGDNDNGLGESDGSSSSSTSGGKLDVNILIQGFIGLMKRLKSVQHR